MFRGLLHVLVTVVVATILAEGMLRLLGVTGTRERLQIYQFDPEIGWKTRPSSRYFRSSPYYAHFTYYDPDGFPTSEERWEERLEPERPSFALLGDTA